MIPSTLGNTLTERHWQKNVSGRKLTEYTWDKPVVVMLSINSEHSVVLVNGFRQRAVV